MEFIPTHISRSILPVAVGYEIKSFVLTFTIYCAYVNYDYVKFEMMTEIDMFLT